MLQISMSVTVKARGKVKTFNFSPHPTSASGENRTNEICTEMNNKRQQTGD